MSGASPARPVTIVVARLAIGTVASVRARVITVTVSEETHQGCALEFGGIASETVTALATGAGLTRAGLIWPDLIRAGLDRAGLDRAALTGVTSAPGADTRTQEPGSRTTGTRTTGTRPAVWH